MKFIFLFLAGWFIGDLIYYIKNWKKKKYVCMNTFVMEIRGQIVTNTYFEIITSESPESAKKEFEEMYDGVYKTNAIAGDTYCSEI